jgi:uncharacterized protein
MTMSDDPLRLSILPNQLMIFRLEANAAIPDWVLESTFFSIVRTTDELSVVCDATLLPENLPSEGPWRAFVVQGPLDFSLTGVLAGLAQPLAQASISIFAISTYDTDYLLVRSDEADLAAQVLSRSGYVIQT